MSLFHTTTAHGSRPVPRIRWASAGVGVLTVVGMLAACGPSNGESADDTVGEDNVIKMHANFEFSGPGSLYGISKVVGVRVAADLINAQGGIEVGGESYTLEVIECDNRTEATYGIQCAQQAADEGVLWTAAPDLGFEGAYEIYKENDILTIGNGGAATDLLMDDPEGNPLLTFEFLTYRESAEANILHLRAMFPEVTRIATLFPNDANGQVYHETWRELAPEYGFEVVAQELHPTDATGDFSSYLTNLGQGDPELIHLGYLPNVAAAAAPQGAQLDVADIFSSEAVTFADLEGADLGSKPFVSLQYAYNWFEGYEPEDDEWAALIEQFDEAAEGEAYLPSVALLGFAGDTLMVKAAIEAADSLDPEDIAAAWPDAEYQGPFGPAFGTPNRSTDQSRAHFVIDENEQVVVYDFESGFSEEPRSVVEVGPRP
ncbi:ABC transporter substrate-binding protein, partial [Phytoactinopolyspora endophytica]|uniref:ABC transporter substrate-binding protein n=1 Tax=Phytoactinopolyspora endophytica TaxID=1642495 RepID=UPI0013EAB651